MNQYIYFSCLLKAFHVFLFILPSFHPLCFPDTHSFICLLLLLLLAFHHQTTNCILLSAAPSDIHEVAKRSHAHAYTDNTRTHMMITCVLSLSFLIHLALCLFEFVFLHFMLTAEWHQQVSWLGQFG